MLSVIEPSIQSVTASIASHKKVSKYLNILTRHMIQNSILIYLLNNKNTVYTWYEPETSLSTGDLTINKTDIDNILLQFTFLRVLC